MRGKSYCAQVGARKWLVFFTDSSCGERVVRAFECDSERCAFGTLEHQMAQLAEVEPGSLPELADVKLLARCHRVMLEFAEARHCEPVQ